MNDIKMVDQIDFDVAQFFINLWASPSPLCQVSIRLVSEKFTRIAAVSVSPLSLVSVTMKHIVRSVLVFVLACAVVPSFAQGISPSEIVIGGVAIGQSEREVEQLLGAPQSRIHSDEGFSLSYSGMKVKIGVDRYGVYEIVSTTRKYCTPSKLCPGMPVAEARRLFGEPVIAKREVGEFLEYYPEGGTCWLQIRAQKGIVKSLRVACQP